MYMSWFALCNQNYQNNTSFVLRYPWYFHHFQWNTKSKTVWPSSLNRWFHVYHVSTCIPWNFCIIYMPVIVHQIIIYISTLVRQYVNFQCRSKSPTVRSMESLWDQRRPTVWRLILKRSSTIWRQEGSLPQPPPPPPSSSHTPTHPHINIHWKACQSVSAHL